MKYRRIRNLLLLITLLILFSCGKSNEEKRDKHMKNGDSYFETRQYEKAIIEYNNAIQADPNFPRGHYQLAQSYLITGQLQQAFPELYKTVDLDPTNLDAQLKLGQFCLLAKRTVEAQEKAEIVFKRRDIIRIIHNGVLILPPYVVAGRQYIQGLGDFLGTKE